MRGVSEVGLSVPNQIAELVRANDGLWINGNEARVILVLLKNGHVYPVTESLHHEGWIGFQLPFGNWMTSADLLFDPPLRHVEADLQ